MTKSVDVFVGLDYHDDVIQVCVMDPVGQILFNRGVSNDVELVSETVLTFGFPSAVAIEACCGSANLAAKLHDRFDWDVRLAHPGYVARIKQGPDKTDFGDAELLADLVRVNYLPEVWLADDHTRQLRRLSRHRHGLVAERKNIKLRIRALLREERLKCVAGARAWTQAWKEWVETVEMGEESRWVLDQEFRRLGRLESEIRDVEKRMAKVTKDDRIMQELLKQPGVGLVTAFTMRAEIGRFDRFRSSKQLSRFCGVSPCNASSGKRVADAGLVKCCNRELRATIIEAAQRLGAKNSKEEKWKQLKQRIAATKPANVATAAVANRWIRWLFHQLKTVTNEAAAAA